MLQQKLVDLESENDRLQSIIARSSANAVKVRELFVTNMGHILIENRQLQKLRVRIKELENELLKSAQAKDNPLRNHPENSNHNYTTLDDKTLLHVFSYLNEMDVLSSQV